jgi:hypothetical protein
MVTAATGTGARRAWQPSFFFWMTVAMAVLVYSGFALTYWQPLLTGNLNPLPPVVHLHGLFYFGWMVLLLVQPALVGAGNLTLHRSLGSFGIAIATGVLITGTLLTLLFGNAYPTDTPNYYDFTYLGYAAVLLFGVLFTLAIRQTRQPDNHRRLMLLATIPLLPPGINRLYQVSLNLAEAPVLATYLTMDVLLAAIVLYDLRKLGRPSRVTLFGAALILGVQLLHGPVVGSQAFAHLSSALSAMAFYR